MKVNTSQIINYEITDLQSLDAVRVMIENTRPGEGRITITCANRAWSCAWYAMSGGTMEKFFARCGNDYLADKMARDVSKFIDADNRANQAFIKRELLQLRREQSLAREEARAYWDFVNGSDDIKDALCGHRTPLNQHCYFQDDVYYMGWPVKPNPEYDYVCRVFDAVRTALQLVEEKAA